MQRLSLCVIGFGWESQPGANSILWIYTEPRLRLIGKTARGKSNWELGGLFRFGAGSISESAEVPVILAPGVYGARHIRTDMDGSGWSLIASYSHAWFGNLSRPVNGLDAPAPTSHRLLLGVGWYQ